MCACICVAHHIKGRRSGSVVTTYDPGMLLDRGIVAEEEEEEEKDTFTHAHTLKCMHKEKGWETHGARMCNS